MLDLFPLLLCGQLLSLPPARAEPCPCPPPCPCRFVLPEPKPRMPDAVDRPPAAAVPNLPSAELERPAVIGTLGVTVADGETIAVVTDYATARRVALDGGYGLLVLASPDADRLVRRARELADRPATEVVPPNVVCLGPAELFPLPGLYEYRPGDLVGGPVRPAIRDPTPAGSTTTIIRGGRQFRCGPNGCSIVP